MDNKDNAGLIIRFIEDKKFGFIKDKKLGEIFFHLNDFKSDLMERPLVNVAVKYKVENREKGYCAKNVTVDIENLYNNTPLTKYKGTISAINTAQQTGVIFDKINKRYFFNFNDVIGNNKVYRNQKVNFYPTTNNKSKDIGILVKLIEEKQQTIAIDNSKLHTVIAIGKSRHVQVLTN